jgi:hypothetical protein
MLHEGEENSSGDRSKIKKTDPEKKYRRVLASSTTGWRSSADSAGEDLGKVDEIMIDIPAGKVAYGLAATRLADGSQS